MRTTRIMKYKLKMFINRLKFWKKSSKASVYIYEDDS